MFIQTHKTTEANLHLPTGPMDFYFHVPKSEVQNLLASGNRTWVFSCPDKPLGACYYSDYCIWDMAGGHFSFLLWRVGCIVGQFCSL